jgi:putative FmdB family regulatory protein
MPIFEFTCEKCGQRFERILKSPPPEEACLHCGGLSRRQVSSTSVAMTSAASSGCSPRGGFT